MVISLSSLALGFCPDASSDAFRASVKAAVSLVRGMLSVLVSAFNPVPGVQGLGNFPGQSFGMPLFPVPVFFPSLSTTCAPNDTVLFRPLVVPGVARMPAGCFEGEDGCEASLGAGRSIFLLFNASDFASFSGFLSLSTFLPAFRSSGAGVPNSACLKALTANWGAGVSGGSMKVVS